MLTEDDIVNIEIAIVLREIVGPRRTEDADGPARGPIVLRIYDKTLGAAVGHRFGLNMRSTVDLATPVVHRRGDGTGGGARHVFRWASVRSWSVAFWWSRTANSTESPSTRCFRWPG